ncbi:MAG: hypothetical protein WB441_14775 [Nocardioidaceae bacterium]
MRRTTVLLSTALLSSGLFAATASPAGACPRVPFYGLTSSQVRIPFSGIPHFKNGPGGSVTATRSTSKSVSFQVTAGAESEVGAVLAKAKVSVSASLTRSQSTDVVVSYHHSIPAGKFGNLRYVSYGRKVNWKKYVFDGSCRQHQIGSGTIKFPTQSEGWYYWTTSQ